MCIRKFLITSCLICLVGFLPAQVSLFNGSDLSGWKAYGTELWYVENGELVCESGPDGEYGYLGTTESYQDFELTLEFKQEADGNSGVFIRSGIEGTRISGWQIEVAPTGKHTGGIYESYGRGWLVKPKPKAESVLREGEWNTLRIKAKGSRVTSWLNGRRMVRIRDELIGSGLGMVALQIHSGGGIKVRWRNLQIREL